MGYDLDEKAKMRIAKEIEPYIDGIIKNLSGIRVSNCRRRLTFNIAAIQVEPAGIGSLQSDDMITIVMGLVRPTTFYNQDISGLLDEILDNQHTPVKFLTDYASGATFTNNLTAYVRETTKALIKNAKGKVKYNGCDAILTKGDNPGEVTLVLEIYLSVA